MKMINKPLKIVCADIYLRFPEIMEDEYKDLIEFIEDNNIVYKSVSNKFKEQEQEIARLNKIIDELEKYINEVIESYGYESDITDRIEKMTLNNVMRKLKELKEESYVNKE